MSLNQLTGAPLGRPGDQVVTPVLQANSNAQQKTLLDVPGDTADGSSLNDGGPRDSVVTDRPARKR